MRPSYRIEMHGGEQRKLNNSAKKDVSMEGKRVWSLDGGSGGEGCCSYNEHENMDGYK